MKDNFLPISILVAAVLIAGALIYTAGVKTSPYVGPTDSNNDNNQQVLVELNKEDVPLGDPKAPVLIVEYSDFQCPFCARFHTQTAPQIIDNYVKTGKARFVYRHFAFLGPESEAAAQAVECAKDQGKFWQYHDAIFAAEIEDGQEYNGNLNRSLFKTISNNLGMDSGKFEGCLDTNKYAKKVKDDYSGAQALGVGATPTTFVNGVKLEGAVSFDKFKIAIEAALNK